MTLSPLVLFTSIVGLTKEPIFVSQNQRRVTLSPLDLFTSFVGLPKGLLLACFKAIFQALFGEF